MTAMHDMSDDEFNDYLSEKQAAVDRQAAAIIAAQNEPRSFAGRRRWEKIALALVMVKDKETDLAWRASTDGDDAKAVSIPKSQIEIMTIGADGLFVVATMKAWVAADRHMTQANNPALTDKVEWSAEQRTEWRLIAARTRAIRETITLKARQRSHYQSRKPMFSRNDCA